MQPNPNPSLTEPLPDSASKPPKRIFSLNRRDRVFALLLFVLTLVGLSPSIFGAFSAAFGVSTALLFVLFSVYLYRRDVRLSVFSCVCGAASLLCCAVFFRTSGAAIRLLTVCAVAALSAVWFCALAGKPIFAGELGLAERILHQVGQSVAHAPRSIRTVCSNGRRSKALLGLLCALPVFCVVVVLLSNSDAAFEGLTNRLFFDAGRVIARLLLAACLFPFLLAFGFSARKEPDSEKKQIPHKGLDTSFIAAFLGLLSAAYLVYLFSQLAYFVSAFSGILPKGYTFSYAEYARRGFFELCGIAAINLTLLYLTLLLSRKRDGKLPVLLRALGTFVDLFTLFLICTAMAKMILYIRQYGATVLRLGTSAFMLCMAVVFLALLVRFFTAGLRVLPIAAVTAAVILLVLGIGDLPGFCAKYNYTHYQNGELKTIDTAYLRRLGDEGIPYLMLLRNDTDETVRENACVELYVAVFERYEGDMHTIYTAGTGTRTTFISEGRKYGGLYAWNLPRARAYAALDRLLRDEPEFMGDHTEAGEDARADILTWF